MKKKNKSYTSMMMFITSMLIFGTIGVFRRNIVFSSDFLAFARGIMGGVFLILFTGIFGRKDGKSIPKSQWAWLIISGALMGLNWVLVFEAYNYTTVAVATLCYYMQPTIVVLLSPVFFREKLTKKKLGCAMVAIFGMFLVSGVLGEPVKGGSAPGVILALLAAVLYATVVMMNKKIEGIDSYQRTTIQLLSAGVVMIPYLFITKGFYQERVTLLSVCLLLVVGIVHTGIAYVLYFGSMEGMKVQSIAILSYIDPVFALLVSAVVLKESLSFYSVVGAILIIGSAIYSELKEE
ncbi:MAG: DMT family transporter [Lachnospiraceae bacterium]|nr:DMT family transporter [Lachnospiraceae bacterium]